MKTTLLSITFYPVKNLPLKHDLVVKVLGAADWRFQNKPSYWKGENYVPEYPLLIPNKDIEIEVLENEVFIIRDSAGKITMRGVLLRVDNPKVGTECMFVSTGAVVFWTKVPKPIGAEVDQDTNSCGHVTLVWKHQE